MADIPVADATPSTQPHEQRAHLLDLPDALLIVLLSSAHCSTITSGSAATTCQELRRAQPYRT